MRIEEADRSRVMSEREREGRQLELDLGFEKENLDILWPAYTSKKEHLPVAAKTKDRQKSLYLEEGTPSS
ncbi:unnamed protein product [Prunus armeniaca]